MIGNRLRVDFGDGERLFPSDVFLNESGSRDSLVGGGSRRPPCTCMAMDPLVDRLSLMSLLQSKPSTFPRVPTNFERRKYGSSRLKPSLGVTEPFYELHLPRATQPEVELSSFLQARARALQRQPNRLQTISRESVGTGVFHPRNLHEHGASPSNSLKKRAPRNRMQMKEMKTQQRNLMTREAIALMKQDDCYYHLPSDMDFSKERSL